jgi:hypothetical protein
MTCIHGRARAVCRERCARCDHLCPVHRGGPHEQACWQCDCAAIVERTGVALLDSAVEVHVDDRQAAARRYRVHVRAWGKVAGTFELRAGQADDEVAVMFARLKPAFRGRGIAAEGYAELARQLAAHELVLASSPARALTPEAARIWEGQVARGFARRAGDHFRLERPPARPESWRPAALMAGPPPKRQTPQPPSGEEGERNDP